MSGARILFVHPTAERYGGDSALLLLVRGLLRRGWVPRVALPEPGPLTAELDRLGVEWTVVDTGSLRRVFGPVDWVRFAVWGLPRSVVQVRRLARRAELVHVNSSVSVGGVLGGWAARRPVVLHVRESHVDHPRLWRWYGRLVAARARRVIAISCAVAAEARAAGIDPVDTVHDGLEFPAPRDRRDRSGAALHLVSVGRLNDWKGHDTLVTALGLLRERGLEARATIAGDIYPGQEAIRDALQRQIQQAGLGAHVRLAGFVEDVDVLLDDADVFALPSRRPEPFGLALAEAMAHGVPCVATAHGGPLDIIEDGVTGLLVTPGDANALADAIERLWRDPSTRHAIGRAGAASVRERFGIERTLDEVERLYRSVLADGSPAGD